MRSVTMKEIDAIRAECADIQKRVHECRERNGPTGIDCSACRMAAEETASRVIRIERMLQQWWAQGCREARLDVPPLGYSHAPASPGVNGWEVVDVTKPLCRMRLAPGDRMAESPDGDAYITDCPACVLALDNERLRIEVEKLRGEVLGLQGEVHRLRDVLQHQHEVSAGYIRRLDRIAGIALGEEKK